MKHASHLLLPVVLALALGVAGCSDDMWSLDGLFGAQKPAAPPPPGADRAIARSPPPASASPADPAARDAPPMPAAPAPADDAAATRPFDFPAGAQPNAASVRAACSFDRVIPSAYTKVFAAGSYAGRPLDYRIDQSGSPATQIDVAVNYRGAPLVLMLGAHEPTIWNIGWSRGTRVAAVLVSGHHRQVVSGLPSSIPTLVTTFDNKGACGFFYVGNGKPDALDAMARNVFGRPVDTVFPARDGRVVVGDALAPGDSLVTGTDNQPESWRAPEAPEAKPDAAKPAAAAASLYEAVGKGLLREARPDDAQAWLVAQSALPAVAGRRPPKAPNISFNAYVVLKPMVLPGGLYGANAATFFVPKGVPRPTGELGHSRVYDFNTLTCAGRTCGFGDD